MASYKWKVQHNCELDDVRDLLVKFEFEKKSKDTYVYPVNEWKELELKLSGSNKIEVTFFWAGSETTEIYFDYLVESGYILGQLSAYLELMSRDDFIFPDDMEDDDDDEEDVEDTGDEEGNNDD